MIRCRNSLLPFLLLAAFLSISAEGCNRTCGDNSVPYPFGFSPSCPIRLNCNKTAATLGGYYVKNITNESILVDIPADCNRGVGAVQSLFGENYAMTSRNGLFLLNCTSSIPSVCSISTELISERLNLKTCGGKGDNISCYSDGRMDGYLPAKNISKIKCGWLFLSIWYTGADPNQPELEFGRAELGWWMNGECRCSANATCSTVETSVPGKMGYRCACRKGFTGDGFVAGDGCKKGLSSRLLSDSVMMLRECTCVVRLNYSTVPLVCDRDCDVAHWFTAGYRLTSTAGDWNRRHSRGV